MAYDVNKFVKVGHLKQEAEKAKANDDALAKRIKTLEDSVPTKVSDLENDSKFQTEAEVATAIQTAKAESGHASFKKVDVVPTADEAEENLLYLVMNSTTSHYDIYALVSGEVVLLDDTTVDLTNYILKEEGKGLSTNDYTEDDKSKLNSIEEGANKYVHPSYTAQASGLYKVTVDASGHVSAAIPATKEDITALGIPGQDTTYDNILQGEVATDVEVAEMLTEVFGE